MLAWITPINPSDIDGARPDQSLPAPPGAHPGGGPMPGGERPDNTLPGGDVSTKPVPPGDNTVPPGSVWPPLEGPGGGSGGGRFYVAIWVPGYGPRWTVIDTGLKPDQGLPGGRPPQPGHQPTQPEPTPHRR